MADYEDDDVGDYAGADLAGYVADDVVDDGAANDGRRTAKAKQAVNLGRGE